MSYTAFAAQAPTIDDATAAAAAANGGRLWGVSLPGAVAVAREIQGEAWCLVVSEEWTDEDDELAASIPIDWPACCAAANDSEMLALGAPVAYLAALLGVQS